MKSRNITQSLFGFSFKTTSLNCCLYYYSFLLTVFLLFISLASTAREFNNNGVALKTHGNHNLLKTESSPVPPPESIRTNLYLLNGDNTTILADGVLTQYNNAYHDSVNLEDAYKFTNPSENLGLLRYGTVLSIERRPVIATSDTLFYKLWKTTRRNYQFAFVTANLNHPGMQGFLQDDYLGTSTILNLNGTTTINFSVNANAASANVNRFRIVYQTGYAFAPLPVSFTSVKGCQLNNKNSISWKVENEINIAKYEIERAANGTDFTNVNSIIVYSQRSANSSYSWLDANPVNGNNFYRIISVDRDGARKCSPIVKLTTGKTGAGSITIYPNPIVNNMVNLQFTNQPTGTYQLRLINNNGQAVYATRLEVNSSNMSQALFTNKKLAAGIYQLEIMAPGNTVHMEKAMVR